MRAARCLAACLLLGLAGPAAAGCAGENLFSALPPEVQAELRARADAVPFPRGNLWRAERDGAVIHLAGTKHVGDDRLAPVLDGLRPLIAAADLLLVEVTEAEEAALQAAIAADPGIAFTTAPPSLREQLGDAEWAVYAAAMAGRGIPGPVAAQFRPWLAFVTLSLPACLMPGPGAAPPGLDRSIMAEARAASVPVAPLEEHEAIRALFETLTEAESLDALRVTLQLAPRAEDQFETLAALYFAGEHRLIWEFGRGWMPEEARALWPPERLEPLYDRLEEALLVRRNRAWMDRILAAASPDTQVLVAVGAAHLSGHDGLLDLLSRAGFTLARLD